MNTHMKTNAWISYSVVVLGFIAVASALGAVIQALMSQPVSEVMTALGSVAVVGWVRLLISPLNQGLLEGRLLAIPAF